MKGIKFQPAHSPDTSLNDLPFFHSRDKNAHKYQRLTMTDVIKVVTREYKNYHTEKLSQLWQMKTAVAKLIHKNQGRNNFDITHNLIEL